MINDEEGSMPVIKGKASLFRRKRRAAASVAAWRPSIRFLPEDYETFRRAMLRGRLMPATFEEWTRDEAEVEKRHRAMGGVSEPVLVQPKPFLEFCERTGLVPSLAVLRVYASEVAARRQDPEPAVKSSENWEGSRAAMSATHSVP